MNIGCPRDIAMSAVRSTNSNLDTIFSNLFKPTRGPPAGLINQFRTPISNLVRVDVRFLENIIRSAEAAGTRVGPWMRNYPESLLAILFRDDTTHRLAIDFNDYNLEPFRKRSARPIRNPGVATPNWQGLEGMAPQFQPNRHATGFKGEDAAAFVELCWTLFSKPECGTVLSKFPPALENLVRRLEQGGCPFAKFAREHPEYIVQEYGLDPTKFDLAAVRERRIRPAREIAGGPQLPLFGHSRRT
jgi:hypothetical protein